jgi:hypothetical protein
VNNLSRNHCRCKSPILIGFIVSRQLAEVSGCKRVEKRPRQLKVRVNNRAERWHAVPCHNELEYREKSFKQISEYIMSNITITQCVL